MSREETVNRHSVKIFCSYAHKDEGLRDELANHLKRAHISAWYDREIKPGTDWANEIDEHLELADIVLLLVSSDFMASRYCYEKEMMRALERHEKEGIFVIPLIMRSVYWQDAPFSFLQVSPSSLKAVTSWANRDEAFVEIATDVRRAINYVLKKKYVQDVEHAVDDERYQDAYGSYLQALSYDQEDGALHQKIGDLLVKLGRYREALDMRRRRVLFPVLIVVVVIAIIVSSLLVFGPLLRPTKKNTSSNPNVLHQLGEFKASNGQLLGVNDGSFAPFLLGPDGQLKQQAATQLKQGYGSEAISLWGAALHITNNDAEAWIYLENQNVLLSGLPYITLVAGTDLFEPLGSDLSALQGVYMAQREFNTGNHGFKIRILIANSGTDTANVSAITQQIVNIAKQDKTVVGVVSWLTSNENIIALPNLSAAHIPIIAPIAASDQLTNASPYFLRIIAPNKIQGKQSALFVEKTLHARKVVIFVDNHDSYSQNAAQDFEDQFTKDGNAILKIEPFTTDKISNIKSLIQDALDTKPDLLFFTSRDKADDANFQDALPTSGPFATLPALAGGAGYVIHKAGYGRWYFDADAFPDELNNIMGNSSSPPPFYQDYRNAFNEDGLKHGGYYGYTRPDSYAMLSYDAASVFSHAIQTMIANNNIALTTDGLRHITPPLLAQTLPHITLQGVSGWIAFDSAGNPINKVLIFLAVSPDGHTYMKDWLGCFTQTFCRNVS